MRISRRHRNRYIVSVYHAGDTIEFARTDRLSIPLIRLFKGTIVTENGRRAAARAWISNVGRFRKRRLEVLGAPVTIREAVINPKSVSEQLIRSSLCPDTGGYMLDNLVEVWFISVHKVS
jgi:hypothetical protein